MKSKIKKIVKKFKEEKPLTISAEKALITLLTLFLSDKLDNKEVSKFDKVVKDNAGLKSLENKYDNSFDKDERHMLLNKIQTIKQNNKDMKDSLIAEFGKDEGTKQYDFLTKPITINDLVAGNFRPLIDDEPNDWEFGGSGKKRKSLLQTVLFDKTKWNVRSAKKWLKENNHKYSDVDKKENYIRFRQIDPELLKVQHYTKYRTKKLDNGIDLVYVSKVLPKSIADF